MQSTNRNLRAPRLFAVMLLLLSVWCLHAQPTATNRVLELDGRGSYVELPANIVNELTEATVEGWVKWDRFGNWMRFFDFGKESQAMVVGNTDTSSGLGFELWNSKQARALNLTVKDILVTGRWCHIAAVTGTGGVTLYLNGALVGTDAYAGSFASIGNGSRNLLGRNNWRENHAVDDFHG